MAASSRQSCKASSSFWLWQVLVLFVVLALVLLTCDTRISAAALRGTEWYREALGWRRLAAGVDTAFLGDQKVMEEWLARHKTEQPVKIAAKRGIVVPAGGTNQLANAFANLHVLRHHLGCNLPVTISYWGSTEPIKPSTMEYFKSHISGLNFLDLSAVQYPAHHRWLSPPDSSASFNGFKVKVFALYAAPYEEVLLIDSDSMPLMDPTLFFEQQAYLQHGNLFWPDRWCTAVRLFGHLGMDDGGGKLPQADSGQLFIDRKRYAAVLEWLLFLNTHDEFTYRYAHGDKDTFRAAFHMAGHGASYFQVPQPLSVALAPGLIYPTPRGFVQHHPNGSLAFVHRTSKAKYSSRELGGRAFSYLLLQPDCHWSERHWHFFTPMASVRRSRVVPSNKCNYSLYDPTAALQSCKGRPRHTSQPPVLEVAAGSYVGQAQAAADESHAAFMEYVQTYAGEQRRQQGWPPLAVFAFVFAVIIALGGSVAVLLRCCRPLRQATMAGTIPKTLKV